MRSFASASRLNRSILLLSTLTSAVSFSSHGALADRFSDSRLLASQCSQCHGTNGVSAGGIDSLAGESVHEIEEELNEVLRPGERGDIMDHQAQGYNSYQITLIAEYFSQLPKAPDSDDD